jgi:hypothetical protein
MAGELSVPPTLKRLARTRNKGGKEMRFLCLVYFEPEALAVLLPNEKASLDRDSMAYDEKLRRGGHYVVAEALEPVRSARTIRVRRGNASATDGPFAETREHLGGFILIEAAGMNEALEIAQGIPLAKLGSIEVRPVMQMSRSP